MATGATVLVIDNDPTMRMIVSLLSAAMVLVADSKAGARIAQTVRRAVPQPWEHSGGSVARASTG